MKEENLKLIEARLESGLEVLRRHYEVRERTVSPALANPVISGRPHHARCFDVEGVGNLLVMTVTEAAGS